MNQSINQFQFILCLGKDATIFMPVTLPNADQLPKYCHWQT